MNKSKTPLGETLWLTGRHAMPEVTVFFHHHHVTYRTPCCPSGHLGHLVILLVSRSFWGRQINPNVSSASGWSSNHSPSLTICLNHSNPQTLYFERFIYKTYHIIKTLLVGNMLCFYFKSLINVSKYNFFFHRINNGINKHK